MDSKQWVNQSVPAAKAAASSAPPLAAIPVAETAASVSTITIAPGIRPVRWPDGGVYWISDLEDGSIKFHNAPGCVGSWVHTSMAAIVTAATAAASDAPPLAAATPASKKDGLPKEEVAELMGDES